MVVIGGYINFCICALDKEATIQKYVNIRDHGDAFRHLCEPTLAQWRKATNITKGQDKSFVAGVFKRKAQYERQRLRQRREEDAARERERVEREKKATDALIKDVSLVQNLLVFAMPHNCKYTEQARLTFPRGAYAAFFCLRLVMGRAANLMNSSKSLTH
jgi:hypothetical protein